RRGRQPRLAHGPTVQDARKRPAGTAVRRRVTPDPPPRARSQRAIEPSLHGYRLDASDLKPVSAVRRRTSESARVQSDKPPVAPPAPASALPGKAKGPPTS